MMNDIVAHEPMDADLSLYAYITTHGKLIRSPANPKGVVIVAEDNKPILTISEISDGEVINLYVKPVGPSSGFVPAVSGGGYELLANQDDR